MKFRVSPDGRWPDLPNPLSNLYEQAKKYVVQKVNEKVSQAKNAAIKSVTDLTKNMSLYAKTEVKSTFGARAASI